MNIGRRSACALVALGLLFLFGIAGQVWMNPALAAPGDPEGKTTQMPAYYDGEQFTVNMKEMPNSDPLIEHNGSINTIYAVRDLDEPQGDIIPVIDAIQSDGFNPLWRQVLITFNAPFPPTQFLSDDEVKAAAAAGEISLDFTDEVYRCSVINPVAGPGPKIPKK